jgi:hypothetical protein
MPFSTSKVPLFEEQTQTINSHCHKVSEQRVSPNPEISRMCLEAYLYSEAPPFLPPQILSIEMSTEDPRQDKELGLVPIKIQSGRNSHLMPQSKLIFYNSIRKRQQE